MPHHAAPSRRFTDAGADPRSTPDDPSAVNNSSPSDVGVIGVADRSGGEALLGGALGADRVPAVSPQALMITMPTTVAPPKRRRSPMGLRR
jgi:hypothetical protein